MAQADTSSTAASPNAAPNQLLREISENIPGFIYRVCYNAHNRTHFEYVSPGVEKIFGLSAAELCANSDLGWHIMHPDDRESVRQRMLTSLREARPWSYRWRIIPKGSQTIRWIHSETSPPVRHADGRMTWDGIIHDVTREYNQLGSLGSAEDELHYQTLNRVVDMLPGLVFQTRHYPDGHFEFLFISASVTDLLGVSGEALQENSNLLWPQIHADDVAPLRESIIKAAQGRTKWQFCCRAYPRTDCEIWLQSHGRHLADLPDGSVIRVGVCTDVTREKTLETQLNDHALVNNEQTFRQMSDFVPGILLQTRFHSNGHIDFLYVSQGVEKILDITPNALVHDPGLFWSLCHPDDRERLRATIQHAVPACLDWTHSWRMLTPSGQTRWLKGRSRHFRAMPDGSFYRVQVWTDITTEEVLKQKQDQLENDVQEARQRLIDINNVIPGCVYLVRKTKSGHWTYPFLSAGGEALFERPLDGLHEDSHLIIEYSHPDDQAMLARKLANSFRFNGQLHVVWRIVTPSGRIKWIRADSRPFRTEENGTVLRAGFFIDVTREKELEGQLKQTTEQLEQIINTIPGGVYQIVTDTRGDYKRTQFASPRLWRNAGLPEDIPMEDGMQQLLNNIPVEDGKAYGDTILKALPTMSPFHVRFRYLKKDCDTPVYFEEFSSPQPLPDSDEVLLTGITLDVSDVVALEQAMEEEKIRAEEASKAKSTFLANVSHEMRTPLNGILGYVQLLEHEVSFTDRPARNMSALKQCSHHLLQVINEVLDMAKIESGRLDIERKPMDLQQLLTEVESIVNPLAAKKSLRFRLVIGKGLPGYINADATRTRQILINLLNNAVKFTAEGEVSLLVEAKDQHLAFTVSDTGAGIPAEQIDSIFRPFERLERHHTQEGTGLGLTITQRIVEALGGTISLTSEEGQGSHFRVLLPYEEAEALAGFEDSADFILPRIETDPAPCLLVVDDRESNRDVMQQWLTMAGFRIIMANNGQEALDVLHRQSVDLVLTDLRMPVMGGYELVSTIKIMPELAAIPCVAISASVFPEEIRRVLQAGFEAFLPKPCRLQKLFATIASILHLPIASAPEPAQQLPEEPAKEMSSSMREEMLDMLDMGDIEGLQERIYSLRMEPGYKAMAAELSLCLDELDMERFHQILDKP